MKGITTCLWFNGQAEEAARFYASVFRNSKVGRIARYGDAASQASGQPKGSTMTVEFEIAGQKFLRLNGGPNFKFTEAVSFVVNCENQREVDDYWAKLTAGGGSESVCGWLKDKFGLSWQVTPTVLTDLLNDEDAERAERVMAALMGMKKINIAALEAAYEGPTAEVRGSA